MNDRLLKESDVLKAVDKRIEELSKDPVFRRKNGSIDLYGIKKYLLAIPTAEGPQGEWIDIGTFSHSYKCSVCGRTLFNITVGKNHVAKYYPYCHCGARMKGADDGSR